MENQIRQSNEMNEIQKILGMHRKFTRERNWDQFQTPKNLSMALSVEASELVEVFMWLTDQQTLCLNGNKLQAAAEEIADVFIYLLRIADVLGIDLVAAAEQKMKKNMEKYPVEMGISLAENMRNNKT